MNGRIQGGADEDQSQWQDSLRPLCVPHQRNPCVQSRCWDVKREKKKKGCSPSGMAGRKVPWPWRNGGSCSLRATANTLFSGESSRCTALSRAAPKVCNLSSRVSNWAKIPRDFHCGKRSCPKGMNLLSGAALAVCGPEPSKEEGRSAPGLLHT